MRNRVSWQFLTTFRQAKLRNKAVLEPEESLEAGLDSDTEVLPFKLTTRQDPAPAVDKSIPNSSMSPELRLVMRKIAKEKGKCIFAEQAGLSILKAAEEALTDTFFVGSREGTTGIKNASYYFIEGILT